MSLFIKKHLIHVVNVHTYNYDIEFGMRTFFSGLHLIFSFTPSNSFYGIVSPNLFRFAQYLLHHTHVIFNIYLKLFTTNEGRLICLNIEPPNEDIKADEVEIK